MPAPMRCDDFLRLFTDGRTGSPRSAQAEGVRDDPPGMKKAGSRAGFFVSATVDLRKPVA